MNIVKTGDGRFIEVQGTAEAMPFGRDALDALLDLADLGIRQLIEKQRAIVGHLVDPRSRMGACMLCPRASFDTPVGADAGAGLRTSALCALEFWTAGHGMTRLDARLRRWFPPYEIVDGDNHVIAQTGEWLDALLRRQSRRVGDLPLDMRGAPFELRVWAALRRIPPGERPATARSRGDRLAGRVARRRHGQRREPVAIIVPCHRVIGSSTAR